MKPYENVRHLRKKILDLTLEDFSKRINLSRSNLGNIETGKIKLTDRVINDICREFNVNKNWLYNGEGEPISISQKDIINSFKRELNLSDDKCAIIQHFLNLTEVQQTAIINLVHSFLPVSELEEIETKVEEDLNKVPTLRLTTRSGHYDMKFTDEVEKGFLEDLNYDDSDDDDFL